MAVQSAAENWQATLGDRDVRIQAGDGLEMQEPDSLDVVLCNPPFHQQQVVGDFLAWRMFLQARAALVTGGALYIVGNRHLGYHTKLSRLFRGVEQVAATPKFVILKARSNPRPRHKDPLPREWQEGRKTCPQTRTGIQYQCVVRPAALMNMRIRLATMNSANTLPAQIPTSQASRCQSGLLSAGSGSCMEFLPDIVILLGSD